MNLLGNPVDPCCVALSDCWITNLPSLPDSLPAALLCLFPVDAPNKATCAVSGCFSRGPCLPGKRLHAGSALFFFWLFLICHLYSSRSLHCFLLTSSPCCLFQCSSVVSFCWPLHAAPHSNVRLASSCFQIPKNSKNKAHLHLFYLQLEFKCFSWVTQHWEKNKRRLSWNFCANFHQNAEQCAGKYLHTRAEWSIPSHTNWLSESLRCSNSTLLPP